MKDKKNSFIRSFWQACALLCLVSANVSASPEERLTTHLLFGSCSHQDKPLTILKAVLDEPKDAFIFLGDNIYGDTEDMAELRSKYQALGANRFFQQLRQSTPTYAIWDDHDYGANDAGKDYPQKAASKATFLEFWEVPADHPRRHRNDGIYGSYVVGKGSRSIRVILPDLRYQRDQLSRVSTVEYMVNRRAEKMGPYKKSKGSMMSEAQWSWLAAELKKPEPIKVLGSSLQVLADFTGWEAWANFDDQQRLIDLIKTEKINGVLLISGDTHWGEISKLESDLDYPLWDITSSGLSEEWQDVSPNKHRVTATTSDVNFGFIAVDWEQPDPTIRFGLKDVDGEVVLERLIRLSRITAY